ncbi:histone-lysine N-methyltransferase SETDB2 [Haemorhous mexicanus]|uniref:histone-lysine N-methyltransferase SETDB2 n=1 Tax=Haemorhous mexicanus TaxID=30427 RepID=UPI0028BD5BFF|nr:histone-lysine N-methyltransferase SETDB2 [Haemorhous mexicanus]
MEEKSMLCDFEEENLTSSREESTEGDVKTFWTQLGGRRVDVIFEQLQNVLSLLKEKIKNGTATNQECWQAWALVNEANLGDLLTLANVSDELNGDGAQETKSKLQPLLPDDNAADTVKASDSEREDMERTCSGNKEASSKIQGLPLNVQYQNHKCSSACLANRAVGSYKGENPLKIPILFDFQRRHAKADCLSKPLDVNYKAPCGRSLRSFRDVRNYLFETECNFLFVDHFSFNTYVLLGRNTMNPEPLVFEFDISNGAESVPISFCNNLDHARLPYFKYRKSSWPRGYYLNNLSSLFVDSCDCTDGCIDRSKCACLQLTARGCSKISLSPSSKRSRGYRYKRLEGPVPSGIYECSVLCRCDKLMCQNRVVQHGIQVRLQVFNTEKKGWGVRCLDDIDKGTFVCTYSGRLMSRAEVLGDAEQELKEKSAVNDRGHDFSSKKRKLDLGRSDSVIELVQTDKNDILENQDSLSQTVDNENKSTLVHQKNTSSAAVRRPGTRTLVFCNHQLKMVHSASSDEDDSSQIHQPSKTKLTSGTKKGKEKSTQQQKEEHLMDIGQTDSASVESVGSERKSLSLQGVECGKSSLLDDTCVVRPSSNAPLKTDCKENSRQPKQDALCEESEDDGMFPKNISEENIYVLDATKEGNVGRFLNHSCCPNLFAQSVFVETHNRSFPWVAFFTNRHVKAGTELTWDYGYEAGSMPETEISCHCGVQKCRKKTLPSGNGCPTATRGSAGHGYRTRVPGGDLGAPAVFRIRLPYYVTGASAARLPASHASAVANQRLAGASSAAVPGPRSPRSASEWTLLGLGLGGGAVRRHRDLREGGPGDPGGIRRKFFAGGSGEAPSRVPQKSCGYVVSGGVQGRAGWSSELPSPAKAALSTAGDWNEMLSSESFPALGAFWIMAKMVRTTCAFCSEGEAGSVMYIATERNIAAHQDCLLFSSGFVESEDQNPENLEIRFDVSSVLKELRRGKRLACNFCHKKGATVGCEKRTCRRSYHFFCALCDDAAVETDEVNGIYRVFCPKHDPGNRTNRHDAANKKRRRTLTPPTITEEMSTEETAEENSLQILKRKNNRHKVRIDFVKKCKQAGLLDDIFEEMLDTLHLAQEKLMDDNTSETEYEETVMALFDCGLFENILTNIYSGTEEKIQKLLENRKRLDHKIELLQDLKEVILPTAENMASTSSTVSE